MILKGFFLQDTSRKKLLVPGHIFSFKFSSHHLFHKEKMGKDKLINIGIFVTKPSLWTFYGLLVINRQIPGIHHLQDYTEI